MFCCIDTSAGYNYYTYMENVSGTIPVTYTDKEINNTIQKWADRGQETQYTSHYSQNELFFLKTTQSITIPHFPIHHNVYQKEPSQEYITILRELLSQIVPVIPHVFKGLTYFFDPTETLKPCFFQVYKYQDRRFLYLMKLDLMFRVHEAEMVERGTNDTTASYTTNHIFLESDLIPLQDVSLDQKKITGFTIYQTISDTWIGETGRGYFVQGIWMDHELTKFFSKLFLPEGKRYYPYFPFVCKYRTICHSLYDLSEDGRKRHVGRHYRTLQYLIPKIEEIQEELGDREFSPELSLFKRLKAGIPDAWKNEWKDLKVSMYLNDNEMKEFTLEF